MHEPSVSTDAQQEYGTAIDAIPYHYSEEVQEDD